MNIVYIHNEHRLTRSYELAIIYAFTFEARTAVSARATRVTSAEACPMPLYYVAPYSIYQYAVFVRIFVFVRIVIIPVVPAAAGDVV